MDDHQDRMVINRNDDIGNDILGRSSHGGINAYPLSYIRDQIILPAYTQITSEETPMLSVNTNFINNIIDKTVMTTHNNYTTRVAIYVTELINNKLHNVRISGKQTLASLKRNLFASMYLPYMMGRQMFYRPPHADETVVCAARTAAITPARKTTGQHLYIDGMIGDCFRSIINEPTQYTLLILNSSIRRECSVRERQEIRENNRLHVIEADLFSRLGVTDTTSSHTKYTSMMFSADTSAEDMMKWGYADAIKRQAAFDYQMALALYIISTHQRGSLGRFMRDYIS